MISAMQVSSTLLHDTVLQFLRTRHAAVSPTLPMAADPLVFEGGLLDSMALIELVAAVEAACGAEVDMLRFDPSAVGTASELVAQLGASLEA